jgi:TRAP-type mannitol/chloroaromatic compound transport system substrate-binding protein
MALSSGVIDAVEFLSPSSDLAVGLQRSAKNYYWPGFNKPNGGSEFLVSKREWESLPKDLAAIVEHACKAEHAFALGEIQRMNEEAYAVLLRDHGVKSVGFPPDLVAKARAVAEEVVAELGTASPIAGRVLDSYRRARERSGPWSAVSLQAFLDAREA